MVQDGTASTDRRSQHYSPARRDVTGSGLSNEKLSGDVNGKHTGEIFLEQVDICDISKGGSCGA